MYLTHEYHPEFLSFVKKESLKLNDESIFFQTYEITLQGFLNMTEIVKYQCLL